MKPYSLDLRQRVVAAAERGDHTIAEVADIFNVGQTFVKKMLRLHRQGESLEVRHGGGAPAALNEDHQQVLRAAVPQAAGCHVRRIEKGAGGPVPSHGKRGDDLSPVASAEPAAKKKSFHASERDERKRRAFRRKATKWEVKKLVFIDEMGSNIALARRYGRAEPGVRVVDHIPSARGENVSTLGALALNGVRTAVSLPGAIDGETFLFFVQQVLTPTLSPGEIVLMDNIPTHKVAGVQEAIEAVGARVEYLPSYSPDLSPIEHFWSKIKTVLRRIGARTVADLLAALELAFATVTLDDILGWFTHCGYKVAPN